MADDTSASGARSTESLFQSMSAEIRVMMPGAIQSFDAATQRAVVVPSCKMQVRLDNSVSFQSLPPILNVPVVVPYAQGAGLLLTLPLRAGDEGMLVFADRAIDNVLQNGGEQPPVIVSGSTPKPRSHSLTDAIFIPGLITGPATVPDWSADAIEIRDRERKAFISLGPNGIEMTDGQGASIRLSGGKITQDATGGLETTANTKQTGGLNLSGTMTNNGVDMTHHVHTGDSGGTTGGPR